MASQPHPPAPSPKRRGGAPATGRSRRWRSGLVSNPPASSIDATTLGQRFVTLSISVLYRGCATAVAWKILPATGKHPWKAEWLSLLKEFRQEIPPGWTVVVMTDRGLYAKWLFQAIQRQGWHPFRRINTKGSFRPVGDKQRRALQTFVPAVGTAWKGAGEAFKEAPRRLRCTLLARWDAGYADPWLVLTDLAAEEADVCWYGLRTWIEQGFKRLKSGGWDWQYTRMTDPERAERLWLVMAVASWWCLRVGGEAETQDALPVETIGPLPEPVLKPPRPPQAAAEPSRRKSVRPVERVRSVREVSIFVRRPSGHNEYPALRGPVASGSDAARTVADANTCGSGKGVPGCLTVTLGPNLPL